MKPYYSATPKKKPYISPEGLSFSRDYVPVPPHSAHDYRVDKEALQIYGFHAVLAACKNPRRQFRRLFATENGQKRLRDEGVTLPTDTITVQPRIIDHLLGEDAVHQGLYLECNAIEWLPLEKLKAHGLVLVLDQVTDPHNVGAIFRSCCAFDVQAIVTTQRHSPEGSGVLAKAASGALETMPFITVQNLGRALDTLKNKGFQIVGLDSEGESDLANTPLKAPLVLVLGAEGKGLRALTREKCDALARLDLPGSIKSLNVSNACALSLYVAHTKIKC
jgi:23S rRNA (guanosine2251-2'-O)-methyltransferase